jgi:hypothetical protein
MRRSCERRRYGSALLIAASLWSTLLPTCASLGQAAPSIEPPQVLSMPELSLPPEVAPPEAGRVEAVITVAADGTATLDDCPAEPAICSQVAAAIAAARFNPAHRDGNAISARVRIVLRVAPPPTAAGAATPPSAPGSPPAAGPAALDATGAATPSSAAAAPGSAAAATPASAATPSGAPATGPVAPAPESPPAAAPLDYGAKAHVRPVQPGSHRLELAEMRDMPGAFGDPFRAVEALPGVVPVLSGLPYFFIRGSPPAGTLYYYDDIPMPTLYHLAAGPAVLHPLMVGPITLYSGVAPARYGRLTGGVIVGEGPAAPDGQTHLEAELRTLDISGYAQTAALGGTVTAAVRYGYPALLLSISAPGVTLAYWDYQLRYAADLGAHDRIELVALGSYDSFGVADDPNSDIALTFHRVESRLIHHIGRDEFGAALLFGWEESALGSSFQLRATRLGPRVWFERRFSAQSRLRLSGDMQGIGGNFSSIAAPGDLNRSINDIGLVGNVPARSLWGLQAELTLRPWSELELQFGARADAWLQAGGAEAVLDPRLRVIVHASDAFDFHVAAGVVHQPAVFFVPLPGIADLANDQGLQTALQSEAGVGWDTPLNFRAELQLFLHRYNNLVFTDTLLLRDTLNTICEVVDCHGVKVPDRIHGYSYGAELFLRRPISERLSGFLSYTLAFSHIEPVVGQPYTPSWDVRHVANLVLQWQIGSGFSAGLRWFVRSGKMNGEYVPDPAQATFTRVEQRLPWFTRLDLETAYTWPTDFGRMRVALEWFNVSLAREPEGVICTGLQRVCRPQYLPAIFFPNLSVRVEH